MSEAFFTSDTHFGHAACATVFRRFASVADHDAELVRRWNETVGKKDIVYHLGDVGLCKPPMLAEILSGLNGHIYLILGNHDLSAEHSLCRGRFAWLKDIHYLRWSGEPRIMLCHYAMLSWRNSHHGSWHLHGHSHGSMKYPFKGKLMDVGVDCNDFRPFHFSQIREVLERRQFEAIDHHVD